MAGPAGNRRKSPATAVVLVAVVVLSLFGAAFAAVTAWNGIGDVAISVHGRLAMALGATLTLGLGGGLMFLVFYSSRRGYDDLSSASSPDSAPDSDAASGSAFRRSAKPSGKSTDR